MAGKKRTVNPNKFFQDRLNKVNKVLAKLEVELEKALNKFMKSGEASSKIIRKNFDEVLDRLASSDLLSLATEKKQEISKELRKLTDDVISKLKTLDLQVAGSILKEIRGNVDQVLNKIESTGVLEIARDKAVNTRKQVLNILSIPSKDDVTELSRKISHLEKKIKTLSNHRKAA